MDESDRLAHYIMGLHGPPSFIRRELSAKGAWEALLARCQADRELMINDVRWNLKYAADRLKLRFENDIDIGIRQVRKAIAGQSATALGSITCQQLASLAQSIDRFNSRWKAYVLQVDLSEVNREREKYNQHYVTEKESVVGSDDIARAGFEPMRPMTPDDVAKEFHPLEELQQFRKTRRWIVWPAYGYLSYLIFVGNFQFTFSQPGSQNFWIGFTPTLAASLALAGEVLYMRHHNQLLKSELSKLQSRSTATEGLDAESSQPSRRKVIAGPALIMTGILLSQLLLILLSGPIAMLLQMALVVLLVAIGVSLNHRGQQLIDEVFMMESMAAEMEATGAST